MKRIKAGLAPLYPAIEKMPIPARLSDNLTVSTMHGCPPDEVESIGRYFITERKYNTAIKLNPTLLGPERLRLVFVGDELHAGVEVQTERDALEPVVAPRGDQEAREVVEEVAS